jgi:abequosyltransferase
MTEKYTRPILSITIPTWNRADLLALNLRQIHQQSGEVANAIEVIVCDNASPDHTGQVVASAIAGGLPVRYIKNAVNIGGDPNFAQCFNEARGKYVLILGDDDVLVDGALPRLIRRLERSDFGVVCLKPFGYETDFRREYPGSALFPEKVYDDAGRFLAAIGQYMTLISACVINKDLLSGVDAMQYCGDNLLHVHLILRAALAARQNVFVRQYQIACKRNNSGGYDFSETFVTNLCTVLDSVEPLGLNKRDVHSIENRLLLVFYPMYLLRQRYANQSDPCVALIRFDRRFHGRLLFEYFLAPILRWPRIPALIWGGLATLTGRLIAGDFRRGLAFIWNRLIRQFDPAH